MKKKKRETLYALLPHFKEGLSSNLNYLHNTLTWTVTLLTIGVVSAINFLDTSGYQSLISLNILLLITFHFSIRASKAYLNVIRYGSLEKKVLSTILNEDNDPDIENLKEEIMKYEYHWKSPLSKSDVIKKVFLELGFLYFIGINLVAIMYTTYKLNYDCQSLMINLVSLVLIIFEFFVGFLNSNYFKEVEEDQHSKQIK